MNQRLRFGRRLPIPSTRQIIHEMRVLQAEEERLKAAYPGASSAAGGEATSDLRPSR